MFVRPASITQHASANAVIGTTKSLLRSDIADKAACPKRGLAEKNQMSG
jgi:hypothetical protein